MRQKAISCVLMTALGMAPLAGCESLPGSSKQQGTVIDAAAAAQKAQSSPATAADAKNSSTADLNDDGFVTLDEVVAMRDAGISDKEMIKRLQKTQQYFELTADQQKYLRDHG